MPLLTRILKQTAVYWAPSGFGPDGQPTYDTPIEIKCRWEDTHEVFVDSQGNDVVSNSMVYVGQDLKVQGQLWLGDMDHLTSQTDPTENEGAYAIRKFEKIPDLRAKRFLRIAML